MDNKLTNTIYSRMQEQFISNSRSLRNYLKATQKQLTVEVDEKDLASLKSNGYFLCFAKKIGDFDYDVIWKSMDRYLSSNIFSWQPIYQIFGTNTFEDKLKVVASTNIKDIGLGEISILDQFGILSDPVTGGDANSINVNNEYGDIHFAISQVSVNQSGQMESTPIYVSQSASILGTGSFKPVEKVQIWFQSNAQTGTMFSELRSNAIEIDLTNKSNATIRYEDGKWSHC